MENIIYSEELPHKILFDLIFQNNYPDIKIMYLPNCFGGQIVRAELVTCTGRLLCAQHEIRDEEVLKNDAFRQNIENSLLKEIGYKFLKNSFEVRKKNKDDEKVKYSNRYIFSLKDIANKNNLLYSQNQPAEPPIIEEIQ